MALRNEISAALVTTQSDQWFMPEGRLPTILTDTAIEECVRKCDLEGPWADECIKAVQAGARKILMVLILLGKVEVLSEFVDKGRAEDAQLPFELSQLKSIMGGDDATARDFYEKQWSAIPVFFRDNLTHRTHHQRTILPFVGKEETLNEGGFGEVCIVTLARSQHRFPSFSQAAVRKALWNVSLIL
jgi:hypothetical protein